MIIKLSYYQIYWIKSFYMKKSINYHVKSLFNEIILIQEISDNSMI